MKLFGRLKLNLDRSISSARLIQLGWLVGILMIFFGSFALINNIFGNRKLDKIRILQLMMDPGVFASVPEVIDSISEPPADTIVYHADNRQVIQAAKEPEAMPKDFSNRPRGFEFLISITGAVFFTGLTISIISNTVDGRVSAYKSGLIRYKFSNHILILGANEMLANMIKSFVSNPDFAHKDIVVLTSTDVGKLYARLYSELNKSEMKNLTLLFGNRDSMEELNQVRALYAERIYIIGEDNEPQHDSMNICCLEKLEKICLKRRIPLKCFMVINNLSSYSIFQYQSKNDEKNWMKVLRERAEKENNLEEIDALDEAEKEAACPTPIQLTVINSLENWAQQVLVTGRYNDIVYPSLDRECIDTDSKKRVHFVVVGMTQMAQAIATAAAHVAHFPNFREGVESTRTRITFISENIEQEMNFFKGHYSSLFKLSNYRHVPQEANPDKIPWTAPDPKYGDFLDIEWEFIDGGIEKDNIRQQLIEWCSDDNENEILTIAICGEDTAANVAASLYLPNEVYQKQIPVLVYQPIMGKVIEQAHKIARYSNVYPFGMIHNCYDPSLQDRLLAAKRINYLYTHTYDYVYMPTITDELDALWYNLTFANKLSNLHAANSIATKLRSVHLDVALDPSQLTARELSKEEIEILARCEHNRWNIEKLLVGFSAMTKQVRESLTKEKADEQKKKYFTHSDIRPYNELSDGSKNYDRAITKHLFDVIKMN